MQHRSGIPNFTDAPGYWENPPDSSEAALELALDLPANFARMKITAIQTRIIFAGRTHYKSGGVQPLAIYRRGDSDPARSEQYVHPLDDVDADDVMSGYWVGYEPDFEE